MRTTFEQDHLIERGWACPAEPDVCWLDCDQPGSCHRVWRGREIVLCTGHARYLEDGSYLGDYAAAPLPPGSFATAWPWQSLDE